MKKFALWLKEASKNIGYILLGIFLIVLAFGLILLTCFPAMAWLIISSYKRHEGKKARTILGGTAEFFLNIAAVVDVLGGVAFGGFFTWLFLTKDSKYIFGRITDTISYVLGFNETAGTLSKSGKIMVKVLDWLDPDHCQKALKLGAVESQRKLLAFNKIYYKQAA